jgi:hypothetical protein
MTQFMTLLGLPVSNKLFKAWIKLLVYPAPPFFLTDEVTPRVPSIHLTRREFRTTFQDLNFHDAYTTYAVNSQATWVTLLSSRQVQELPEELKLELLQLQAKLGRGQIYSFDEYKSFLKDDELRQALNATFDYEGKTMLELNHTLWNNFSFETQKNWLAKFISEDRSDCLSSTLSKSQWQHINKHYPAVKHLIGFAEKSGSNCFATVLAGTLDIEKAKIVSSLWLQRETFLREIEKQGYKKTNLTRSNLLEGSILVWQNDKGLVQGLSESVQHACLYLGEDLVFNKDAQGWFAPRQILSLETVLQNWQDEDLKVQVFTGAI